MGSTLGALATEERGSCGGIVSEGTMRRHNTSIATLLIADAMTVGGRSEAGARVREVTNSAAAACRILPQLESFLELLAPDP